MFRSSIVFLTARSLFVLHLTSSFPSASVCTAYDTYCYGMLNPFDCCVCSIDMGDGIGIAHYTLCMEDTSGASFEAIFSQTANGNIKEMQRFKPYWGRAMSATLQDTSDVCYVTPVMFRSQSQPW